MNKKYSKIKRVLKRIGLISVCSFTITSSLAFATINNDEEILSTDINETYMGRKSAKFINASLGYTDVKSDFWGAEAITRMSSIGISNGYVSNGKRTFKPQKAVSKEEAIAMIIRAFGYEEEATKLGENIAITNKENDTKDTWSQGYLTFASNQGLITAAELEDGLMEDAQFMSEEYNWVRTSGAKRQDVARWLVKLGNKINPKKIEPIYDYQDIYGFDDWNEIGEEYKPYVEEAIKKNIMQGNGSSFNPKGIITRAEMMQVLKNVDEILYDAIDLKQRTGYVAHIEESDNNKSTENQLITKYYIRTEDGKVDILESIDSNLDKNDMDAATYKNGKASKMQSLNLKDRVQYLINDIDDEVYYIEIMPDSKSNEYNAIGRLKKIDFENGLITISANGKDSTYVMANNLYDTLTKKLVVDGNDIAFEDIPVTHTVKLTVNSEIVNGIELDTTMSETELAGIVIENNVDFNYIRITDWDGKEKKINYNRSDVIVEKRMYYDEESDAGYLDEIFDYYGLDEDDSDIRSVEAGDIIHIIIDPNNENKAIRISAKTNYIIKYGEVINLRDRGDYGTDATIKLDNKSVVTYNINEDIPILIGGVNKRPSDIEVGSIIRMLVNQAILKPGTLKESVKEVVIDEYGNDIKNVYKGELGHIDKDQQEISIYNSYELLNSGWKSYDGLKTLDMSSDFEVYYNGQAVTIDYANKYLRLEGMDMYVATEKYYDDERVSKISFRGKRDSVLDFSNISVTNGINKIGTLKTSGDIAMDEGTIIVKNDKLISSSNVMAPDYAQIVLNGYKQAAVIRIIPEPNNEAISVMRGRIRRINELENFTVSSHAVLEENKWTYTPIQRTYTIDYNTVVIEGDKTIDINDFLGFTENTKIDKVYNIFAEGTKAKYIVSAPYSTNSVIGEIYNITGNTINLKETLCYNSSVKKWEALSNKNTESILNITNESVIIKNNEIVSINSIKKGDKIRIMTNVNLPEQLKKDSKREFTGYIIYVEG